MKQGKLAYALFISSALLSTQTFAHETYKSDVLPLVVSTTYNWTGYYVGLNAGLVQHTMNITDAQATTFNSTIQQASNPNATIGLQTGYRRQMDATKVTGLYGVEFSANFANATYKKDYGSPFALYQLNTQNTLKNWCLLQFIGGITADKALLFIAAGMSWTNITGSVTNQASVHFFNSFSLNKKALGTAVGGGIEYALNEKLSVRLKVDVITPNNYTTSDNTGDRFQITNSFVQGAVGLNYRIG